MVYIGKARSLRDRVRSYFLSGPDPKIDSILRETKDIDYILTDSERDIQCLFKESKKAGAEHIMFDTLNPYPKVWRNMKRIVKKHFPERIEFLDYYYNNQETYARQLRRLITRTGRQYKLHTTFAF